MSPSRDMYLRALEFAARAHGEQKTPHQLPYLFHVVSVTAEVTAALRLEPGRDEPLALACALLHDVVEDTETAIDRIEHEFGAAVASGVLALTKNADLPKADRMADSLRRIAACPPEVAMVKLADRITNLGPPPPAWSQAKIDAYAAEARLIVDTLGAASPALAARLRERLAAYPASS